MLDNKKTLTLTSYLVPNSVVQFRSSFHTDQDIRFADLHFRNTIAERKHKPVLTLFGVSVEDDAFGIEGSELKGGGDAAGEATHGISPAVGLSLHLQLQITGVYTVYTHFCITYDVIFTQKREC